MQHDLVLLCGDFNNLINNTLDNISGKPHGPNEIKAFNEFVDYLDLTDTFRFINPTAKEYSWIRFLKSNNSDPTKSNDTSFIARRIDYILTNQYANSFIKT